MWERSKLLWNQRAYCGRQPINDPQWSPLPCIHAPVYSSFLECGLDLVIIIHQKWWDIISMIMLQKEWLPFFSHSLAVTLAPILVLPYCLGTLALGKANCHLRAFLWRGPMVWNWCLQAISSEDLKPSNSHMNDPGIVSP